MSAINDFLIKPIKRDYALPIPILTVLKISAIFILIAMLIVVIVMVIMFT